MRGGIALIRKSLFSYMASRGFFWTLAVSWMMGPLVFLFVWIAASGTGSVGGFDKNAFIFYYLILILVNQFSYPCSHWVIGENIQVGTLSTWLMRPLPMIFEAVAADVAMKIVCMPVALVMVAVLAVFLGFNGASAPTWLLLFMPALLMACLLRFLFSYLVSLLAFWTEKIDALLAVNDTLVFLLAGQVAPTVLLPGFLGTISSLLPFRYMLGFPVEVLSGMLPLAEVLKGLCIQAFWLVTVVILQKLAYSRGIRRYTAIGG
jgi:ABC-2 type transport system permease protein